MRPIRLDGCPSGRPCYLVFVDHPFNLRDSMDREPSADRAWRASAEIWPGAIARIVVLTLILLAPWIGSTSGFSAWIWVPALVILVCWIFTPELSHRGTVAAPTLFLPLAGAAV